MLSDYEICEVGILLLEKASIRSVEALFHTSQRTLRRLREKLLTDDFSVEQWKSLNDQERREMFYRSPQAEPCDDPDELSDMFENIYQKLERQGSHYSIKSGWIEYKKKNPNGMQKSRFYIRYRKWEQLTHPGRLATAPVNRQPGKYLYIDWVGDQIPLVRDPKNPDKKLKAHILVFTMGYSSLSFAMAFPDEKTPSVVEGINQALLYMDALPLAFRPDNMKTAVTSNTSEGLVLSTAMEDLQNYYDVPVLPARPLKPKDKASCERFVLLVETEILPHLEGTVFEGFEDLNTAILEFTEEINTRIKSGESLSRRELFELYDLPHMKTLPDKMFSLCEYRRLKVQRNCHVKFADTYYSVPYKYVGQTVTMKIRDDQVEICDQFNRHICNHTVPLVESRTRYVTNETHLKSSYQKARAIEQRGIHYFYDQASQIGPSVKEYLELIAAKYSYEEQAYGSFSGIINNCKYYPRSLANQAAENCLRRNKIGYRAFCSELKNLADENKVSRQAVEPEHTEDVPPKVHANIRGKDYYK